MAASNGQTLPHQSDTAQEPSMEDILASIRRIIASDQHVGQGRTFGTPAKTLELPSLARSSDPAVKPVLAPPMPDFDDGIAVAAPAVSVPEPPALNDLEALVLPPAPIPTAETNDEALPYAPDDAGSPLRSPSGFADIDGRDRATPASKPEPLLSSSTGASVTSSFQVLSDSMLMHDPAMMERLTREALRPMLKTWLDENLPSMVERLVRAEIERVARGGRSRG